MHQHLIAFLDTRPDDELAKMLNWAINSAGMLDDRTPYEERTLKMLVQAVFHLERKERSNLER